MLPKTLQTKLAHTRASFLGQVVSHFEVDMVWRNGLRTRPAFFNDGDKFLGDVNAPAILPAVFEPVRQLLTGAIVQHIDVEFSLLGESGKVRLLLPR